MENASLAIRMAGGVLIALLIVGVFISVMVVINGNQQQQQDEEDLRQVTLFNEPYKSYENRIINGYQLLSLVNRAIDYNQRMTKEKANGGADYTPIHIYVKTTKEGEKGHVMLPGQTKTTESRNANKDNYIDLNDYYEKRYSKLGNSDIDKENKNEFKNMYFKWDNTKHVAPNEKDVNGKDLGSVDGVGRVYEMYFTEYLK